MHHATSCNVPDLLALVVDHRKHPRYAVLSLTLTSDGSAVIRLFHAASCGESKQQSLNKGKTNMLKFRVVAFSILLSLVLSAYRIFLPSTTNPDFITSSAQTQNAAK